MPQIPHAACIGLPYTSCLPSYPALASQLLPSSLAALPQTFSLPPSNSLRPFVFDCLSTSDTLPRSLSLPALPHSFLASDPLTSMPRIPKLLGLNSLPVSGSDFHTASYYSFSFPSSDSHFPPCLTKWGERLVKPLGHPRPRSCGPREKIQQ